MVEAMLTPTSTTPLRMAIIVGSFATPLTQEYKLSDERNSFNDEPNNSGLHLNSTPLFASPKKGMHLSWKSSATGRNAPAPPKKKRQSHAPPRSRESIQRNLSEQSPFPSTNAQIAPSSSSNIDATASLPTISPSMAYAKPLKSISKGPWFYSTVPSDPDKYLADDAMNPLNEEPQPKRRKAGH